MVEFRISSLKLKLITLISNLRLQKISSLKLKIWPHDLCGPFTPPLTPLNLVAHLWKPRF